MTDFQWQKAVDWLEEDKSLVLMVVVASEGSAPGKHGFKMLVCEDGRRLGTIGGGIMERKLAEQAQAMARDAEARPMLVHQEHRDKGPKELRSGMICAGFQKIALVPMHPERVAHLRTMQDGSLEFPCLRVTQAGWELCNTDAEAPEFHLSDQGESWCWQERLDMQPTVFVIGGGHVGLALCRVLALTDFHVINFDHREDVDTFKQNNEADQRICCPYKEMGQHMKQHRNAYAVVVTTSYPTDVAALVTLSKVRPGYVGLMGSAAKIKRINADLLEAGVDQDWIDTIVAPIGVGIKNRTPVEIAISISAQIIDLRNQKRG